MSSVSSPPVGWRTPRTLAMFVVLDEFPTTVTGKVRKIEIREQSVDMRELKAAASVRNA